MDFFIFRMTDNQPPERYELEQLLSRDQLEIPGKSGVNHKGPRLNYF